MKNFISIWLPHLELNRLERDAINVWAEQACVVATKIGNKDIIIDANKLAVQHGIEAGQSLTRAMACFDGLAVHPHNAELQAILLKKLARYCLKYSPKIMQFGQDRLLLDVTGCTHLFGGKQAMLQHVIHDFSTMGFELKLAMAYHIRAANALVHTAQLNRWIFYENKQAEREAVLKLPVEYLHIEDEVITQLQRLGLRTVQDLMPIKSASLVKRFGQQLMLHFNQALGREVEAFDAMKFSHSYRVEKIFSEPVMLIDYLEAELKILLGNLLKTLAADDKAVRHLVLTITRPDHTQQNIEIGTAQPDLNQQNLFKLFALNLDKLIADFGIDKMSLTAVHVEHYIPKNVNYLTDRKIENTPLSHLFDHIGNRIGFDNIITYLPAQSHIPERAYQRFKHGTNVNNLHWLTNDTKRPMRLLIQPYILFDFSFDGFEYKGEKQQIIGKTGPERISPEWWWDDPLWKEGARDYWWLFSQTGRQFWVFVTAQKRYFLHGLS